MINLGYDVSTILILIEFYPIFLDPGFVTNNVNV